MTQGPNVKKLIIRKMVLDAIPPSTPDGKGFETGIQFLLNKDRVLKTAKEATAWVEQALAAVKAAKNNPYGDDDELIAGAILKKIEEKEHE